MSLRFAKSALVAALATAAVSVLAQDGQTRYWLHPKLGYMVQPSKPHTGTSDTAPTVSGSVAATPDARPDTCKPKYWLPPKGEMRRITPPGCRT